MGIIIACIIIFPWYRKKASPAEIEVQARKMGMMYIDEIKAIPQDMEGEDK